MGSDITIGFETTHHYLPLNDEELNTEQELVDLRIAEIVSSMIIKRKNLNLTQKDIAMRTGIPQSSISRIESLSVIPTLPLLIRILNVMGSTIKTT